MPQKAVVVIIKWEHVKERNQSSTGKLKRLKSKVDFPDYVATVHLLIKKFMKAKKKKKKEKVNLTRVR